MAFTEHTEYKEEILPNQTIQVRRADVPGQDVSDQPAEVQAIAAALWTAEVVAAYQAQAAASALLEGE